MILSHYMVSLSAENKVASRKIGPRAKHCPARRFPNPNRERSFKVGRQLEAGSSWADLFLINKQPAGTVVRGLSEMSNEP